MEPNQMLCPAATVLFAVMGLLLVAIIALDRLAGRLQSPRRRGAAAPSSAVPARPRTRT